MNKYEILEEKIRSMSFKEIVLAMVDSLRNPVTEINMFTFGFIEDGICYGCAATNTICKLGGFDPKNVLSTNGSFYRYESNDDLWDQTFIITSFESAIDSLRQGHLDMYERFALRYNLDFCKSESLNIKLPYLGNSYSDKDLKEYEDFANSL